MPHIVAHPAKILVVYTPDSNTTRQMAEAVGAGVAQVPGASADVVVLATGAEVGPRRLLAYDGLVIGTPARPRASYNRLALFMDDLETLWARGALAGMVGGVFAVGVNAITGTAEPVAGPVQTSLVARMSGNGMIVVPLLGRASSADYARPDANAPEPIWLTDDTVDDGRRHGADIARTTLALKPHRQTLFARAEAATAALPTAASASWIGAAPALAAAAVPHASR